MKSEQTETMPGAEEKTEPEYRAHPSLLPRRPRNTYRQDESAVVDFASREYLNKLQTLKYNEKRVAGLRSELSDAERTLRSAGDAEREAYQRLQDAAESAA